MHVKARNCLVQRTEVVVSINSGPQYTAILMMGTPKRYGKGKSRSVQAGTLKACRLCDFAGPGIRSPDPEIPCLHFLYNSPRAPPRPRTKSKKWNSPIFPRFPNVAMEALFGGFHFFGSFRGSGHMRHRNILLMPRRRKP